MATATFDKKITLDRKAIENFANASSISKKDLGNIEEPKIESAQNIKKWFSHLQK